MVSACQEWKKARTRALLQNCNLCFQYGNKTQPFVSRRGRRGGGGTPERPRPGCRWEAARLAPAQTYRGEAFLGWPTAEMPNPTTAAALLCNRAWMEIKVGAGGGGGGRGLTERGKLRLMLAASPQGSEFEKKCQESATEAGTHLGSLQLR